MENAYIKWLEDKIETCLEDKDLQREHWAFCQSLKKYRQLSTSSDNVPKKIELTRDELLHLLKEAYRTGYASYEIVDAGLERSDSEGYARWVMMGLK